jgi:hypothetical protein
VFRIRLRDVKVDRVTVGDVSAELVGAESSLLFEGPGIGWGFSYRRPIRVETEGQSVAIRDHVMLARLAAIAIALTLAIRRLNS